MPLRPAALHALGVESGDISINCLPDTLCESSGFQGGYFPGDDCCLGFRLEVPLILRLSGFPRDREAASTFMKLFLACGLHTIVGCGDAGGPSLPFCSLPVSLSPIRGSIRVPPTALPEVSIRFSSL